MLRALFILGATALLGAIVGAWGLLWLGQLLDTDLAAYASIVVLVALLVWIVAMIGGFAYRLIGYFAKPS